MNNTTVKNRKIYYLSIFCLVPFIGIFIGLIIILFGAIKYKKWNMILLGIVGCIVSLAISFSLVNYLKNSDQSKKAFGKLSQNVLNSLVANIEFYKIEHGSYPDSLVELNTSNKSPSFIEDPLSDWGNSKSQTKFNYKKVGENYRLFSSGVDMIAETKDDIYPQINLDSVHIGLIK